jgi:ribosomal protein S18 acetylase RimI-like enzyme
MVEYTSSLDGLRADDLPGFFVGWRTARTPEEHLRILRGSAHVVLALHGTRVVGFVTAVSDGVLSAYIPLLEVLPEYQGRGIGTELVRRLLEKLESLYMVDLSCDAELEPFYSRFGFQVLDRGMGLRR